MAESVVAAIAQKLCNLLVEEVIFLQGVHDQVEWMERQLRWMQFFLRDADAKRRRGHVVAYWVRQVRETAFDAEDIVDTYILNMHRHQMHSSITRYACIFRELPMSHDIGMQIEGIKTRLREIHEHRTIYDIGYNVGESDEQMSLVDKTVKERRELALQRSMNVVVGLEDDMKSIMEVLLDKEKQRRCVISIVGMGGLGKSTLARRICDESSVKQEFRDRCALVSVSQSYTVSKVLKDIAKGLPNFVNLLKNRDDETEIRQMLPQFLEGGKYLIVLDDVWGTEVWTLIQPFLPDKQNGSRVIITTRSMDVARSAADPSTPPHQLKTLDEKKSWELFTKVVFPGEEVEKVCTGELEKLGKEIVKNCGGLPLALVVTGGLLSMKERSVRAWEHVKGGFHWKGSPEGEVSSKILALSYEALPPHLKSCFLYFSCFPEDFEIVAEKLVRLWVAEGFIPDEEEEQQGRKSRTTEEIAEGWLEDLIQRCLVQVVEMSPSGRALTCRIHDLLLDLAINEAKEVNFFYIRRQNTGRRSPPNTARRLALHPGTEEGGYYTSLELSAPKLRSFLGISSAGMRSLQFIKRFELLRVLDLEGALCGKLPSSIGRIIHLRYLGLRHNELRSIPSSVRKLRNLQTLDVMRNALKNLPKSVWGIRTLRHVFTDSRIKPRIAGKVDQQLVNLQTLRRVKAGSWMQKSLATMRNLRVLAICHILLPTHHLALTESLDSLLQLRSLELRGGGLSSPLPRKALALHEHRHLEELTLWGPLRDHPERTNEAPPDHPNYTSDELPPNLNKLVLYKSRLQQDPLSLLEKLPHLRFLELINDAYVGEEAVCSAGGFPQLESLQLWGLRHIKKLRVEDQGALPRLNRLDIRGCDQLEEVPPQLKNVPTLDINIIPESLRRRCFQENIEEAAAAPQVEVAAGSSSTFIGRMLSILEDLF